MDLELWEVQRHSIHSSRSCWTAFRRTSSKRVPTRGSSRCSAKFTAPHESWLGVRKVSFAEVRKEQARSQGEGTRIVQRTQNAMPGVQQGAGDRGAWLAAAVRLIRIRPADSTSPDKLPSGQQLLAGRRCRHPANSSRAGLALPANRARDGTSHHNEPLRAARYESIKRAASPGAR
jgi:hypothetical protein